MITRYPPIARLLILIFALPFIGLACSVPVIEDILRSSGQEIMINALAIDPMTPSTLYAGTNFGMFKSTDGGEHWSQTNTGLTVLEVHALAIDPQTPTTLYAGTMYGHVFKSSDGAGSWSENSTGLATNFVHVLAIDPITPTTLYAGTSPVQSGPLYKSTNAGETWSLFSIGLEGTSVHSFAIDPQTPTTIYAGTHGTVVKSIDGGENWFVVNIGSGVEVAALAIDPVMPTTLYAGGQGGPIFWSEDGGGTWSASSANHFIYALAITQETPSIIYAGTNYNLGGVLQNTDGGPNWNSSNTGLPDDDIFALAIDPMTPATLYAGTRSNGVFKSTDGGASWNPINTGLNTSGDRSFREELKGGFP